MYIWPGIKLQAYKTESVKNKDSKFVIKNGLFYLILSIKEGKITIRKLNNDDLPEGDEMFMLLEDVSCNLLLTYAYTYHKSQARTIRGTLRLDQTWEICFTHRHLIVGIGRAPKGCDVQVM